MKECTPQLVYCQRGPMVQGTSFESKGLLNGSIPGEDIYFHFDFFFACFPFLTARRAHANKIIHDYSHLHAVYMYVVIDPRYD